MIVEQLLELPGFLYEISGKYYYLGKWICKECTDLEASDCVTMYHMCRDAHEDAETSLYFQKLRAFSDFALEIPYNPTRVKEDMTSLIHSLTDAESGKLTKSLQAFQEDLQKYNGQHS